MAAPLFADIPVQAPRRGNRFSKALGRALLKAFGWRVTGRFPAEPKLICAVAPHTSNWDFVIGMAAVLATGINARYLMKKEAFIWPFARLFVWLGGEPLDRQARENTVEQIAEHFARNEQLWLGITPEGTRKRVECWKTGFLRIAEKSGVPVLLVGFDYTNKEIVLDKLWPTTGDHIADAAAIRNYMCQRFVGRHPHQQ